jgi:CubicO group peptidase (beta-lactamase class C family)
MYSLTLTSAHAQTEGAPAPADRTIEEHITRIRADIPPALIIEGALVTKTSLSERMAALHVPGVSIAVIHSGALEWARGFGVMKAGGAPVTADTLFQAASISKPITALGVLRLVDVGKLDLDTSGSPDASHLARHWPRRSACARQG